MLPDLLEVSQARTDAFHDGAHAAEGGDFQGLAPVERVAVLDEPHVVCGDSRDEVFGGGEVGEGELVVVLVVEDAEEVVVERVDVVEAREVVDDGGELLGEV